MLVAFLFIDRIVDFMLAPTRRMLPRGTTLIYTQPGEAFGLYVNVAFIAGSLLASPFVMLQVWRFIAPGLYATEKKLVVPFVFLMSAGAVGGAAFSHYVMFPALIAFFGTFQSADLGLMPRLNQTVFAAPMVAQLPPTLRGLRVRGMNPREVAAFQGWCVWVFGGREGGDAVAWDG
jgi:Sec-independent protein secretion pathway component TatC